MLLDKAIRSSLLWSKLAYKKGNLMENAKTQKSLFVRLFTNLAIWVVIGIVGGVIVGMVVPELGIASKPGIDYFIKST